MAYMALLDLILLIPCSIGSASDFDRKGSSSGPSKRNIATRHNVLFNCNLLDMSLGHHISILYVETSYSTEAV